MATALKVSIIIFSILILFVIILMFLFRPLVSYLNKPSNLKKAAANGKTLAKSKGKTVVAVVAHPDDAEWYAGGTLGLLAQKNDVILVLGNSGEKGTNQPNLDKVREKKQLEAKKILGYKEAIFLRHPDRGLKNDKIFRREIKSIFKKNKPDIVITFDSDKQNLIYRHPDHLAAGQATTQVLKDFKNIDVYYFHSSAANTVVDFSSVKERKRKALRVITQYGRPGILIKILGLLFGRNNRLNYGMNERYPQVGVENGELFRRVNL